MDEVRDVCENMVDVVIQKLSEIIETNKELINESTDFAEKERLKNELVGLERAKEEIFDNKDAIVGRCYRWSQPI